MTSIRAALAILLAGAMGLACSSGSRPIPHLAVAGTSITIAIPKEILSGFGTQVTSQSVSTYTDYIPDWAVPYAPGGLLEDEQRGDMVFYLFDGIGTEVTRLSARVITRVEPAELTRAGLDAVVNVHETEGQTIALLDIPPDVPPDDYTIRVRRAVRDKDLSGGPFVEGSEEWVWLDQFDPNWAGLRIVAGDGAAHYTPLMGFTAQSGRLPVGVDLAELVPHPSVTVLVRDTGGQFGELLDYAPAAYEFELEYPRRKVEIVGVSLLRLNPSRAIATFEDLDGPLDCAAPGPGDETGRVRIIVADPEATTRTLGVRVGFRPINFLDGCGSQVTLGDFPVVPGTFMHYELDGSPSTVPMTPLVTNIS